MSATRPTPYYHDERSGITIYCGDCREVLPSLSTVDLVLTDPPYGETSLAWDRRLPGWPALVRPLLTPAASVWCFGSLRAFMATADDWAGWQHAQEVVWKKHNGSNFHADRFRRVHELVGHFYVGRWGDVYKAPQYTYDATARTIRSKSRPPHTGYIERTPYTTVDGGPRLMRSVIEAASCHGYADHPTQKPVAVLVPLIEYSCPPGGVVLDLFAGVGSTLEAARLTGRRAFGIEAREDYCRAAADRLSQMVLPGLVL